MNDSGAPHQPLGQSLSKAGQLDFGRSFFRTPMIIHPAVFILSFPLLQELSPNEVDLTDTQCLFLILGYANVQS
jgi:hypothetical protein